MENIQDPKKEEKKKESNATPALYCLDFESLFTTTPHLLEDRPT